LKALLTAVIVTTFVAMAVDALLALAVRLMPPSAPLRSGIVFVMVLFGPMLTSLAIGFAVRFREWRTYPIFMWLYGFAMFCVLFAEYFLLIPWHDMP
jgi:hypothetical protein